MAPVLYVCGTDGDKKIVVGMAGTPRPLGQDGPNTCRGKVETEVSCVQPSG